MIYTIIGENQLERKKAVDEIVQSFNDQHGNLAIERFDAEETEEARIIEALQSLPFLSGSKLVVVDRFTASKVLTDSIEQIISSIPETNTVVFTDVKLDKRAKYSSLFKKLTDLREYAQVPARDAPAWVVQYCKSIGATLSPADARFLVERVGNNQTLLANEVQKLALYDTNITKESIMLLCEAVPQSSTFELLDAAFAGNHVKAQYLYEEQRAQKVEPLAILGMIAWQLHVLAVVIAGEVSGVQDIASKAKLNPFVASKTKRLATRLKPTTVKRLVERAYKLDVTLKSQAIDSDDAMRHFLLLL